MRAKRSVVVIAAILGTVLRLVLAWNTPGNYDQQSYAIVVDILDRGGNVYAETARYNYSPVWMYVLYALSHTASFFGVPFAFAPRAFLAAVDLLVALAVARIATATGQNGTKAFLVYYLNPISVLLTGLHGQFDNLAALPLLVAVNLAIRALPVRSRWTWAMAKLAVCIKHTGIVLTQDWRINGWKNPAGIPDGRWLPGASRGAKLQRNRLSQLA